MAPTQRGHPEKYGTAASRRQRTSRPQTQTCHTCSAWPTIPVRRSRSQEGTGSQGRRQAHEARTPKPARPRRLQSQADVDKLNSQRDAGTILSDLFTQYGLGSLAGVITGYIKQGYSADAITVLLSQTPEYKQRFAANDIRIKKGLPALSPAEYIATERSYRQVMSAAGLPVGFYDSNSTSPFLANDMSPTELKQRVDTATTAVNQAPQEVKDYFGQWYGTGDMIAYALDPAKAEPLIEQRIKAAEAAGVGKTQGVSLTQQQAEGIGSNTNLSLDQIQQGMGFVGQNAASTAKLDQIYGDNVTQDDLVKEVFQNDGQAAQKRQKLASKERAAFNGSGAAGGTALNTGQTDFNS
jgi:hypothetical protein